MHPQGTLPRIRRTPKPAMSNVVRPRALPLCMLVETPDLAVFAVTCASREGERRSDPALLASPSAEASCNRQNKQQLCHAPWVGSSGWSPLRRHLPLRWPTLRRKADYRPRGPEARHGRGLRCARWGGEARKFPEGNSRPWPPAGAALKYEGCLACLGGQPSGKSITGLVACRPRGCSGVHEAAPEWPRAARSRS